MNRAKSVHTQSGKREKYPCHPCYPWLILFFAHRLVLYFTLTVVFSELPAVAAQKFRVATYNVENYLDKPAGSRPVKSASSRVKVCAQICALQPDVIALEEMGARSALLELQAALKTAGLDLPYAEHVGGSDTNIFVAVLSRFPFAARRPHTNEQYLLMGRRFQVSRGFAELDIRVNEHYRFTLIAAHLKSRRPVPEASEAEMREQEAIALRAWVDARFAADPAVNLVVVGDFNDTRDSAPVRAVVGRPHSNRGLIDTRPAEFNGDTPAPNPKGEPRSIAWTHFYDKNDTYSRIDYIFLSKGMAREWLPAETFVLASANWGQASDHRPLVAAFEAEDK